MSYAENKTFRLNCPRCRARQDVPVEYAGRRVKCKQCSQVQVAQMPVPEIPVHGPHETVLGTPPSDPLQRPLPPLRYAADGPQSPGQPLPPVRSAAADSPESLISEGEATRALLVQMSQQIQLLSNEQRDARTMLWEINRKMTLLRVVAAIALLGMVMIGLLLLPVLAR